MSALRSMTGYGAATAAEGGIEARTELRSVNHRFLQIKVRLPAELASLESEVEALVRDKLERGAVTINIAIDAKQLAAKPELDRALAKRWHKEIGALAKELGLEPAVTLDTLLALPGVVAATEDPKLREREGKLIAKSVRDALTALVAMRAAEGKSLAADLDRNAKELAKLALEVEKRMPKVVKEHHEALKKRVGELLEGRAGTPTSELPRELALLADRMDVGEELARLASHLEQWKTLVGKGGAIGRQLDFLVQELLREANTIGSKCNDAEVVQIVVEIKTRIERLREQVQNVE